MLQSSCLFSLVYVIEDALKHSGIKRLSSSHSSAASTRFNFSINLALVAVGIRGGYLLDTFVVEEPGHVFEGVLKTLKKESDLFKDLKLAYDTASGQCFFLNKAILTNKWLPSQGSVQPDGVLLSNDPSVVELPEGVIMIARDMAQYFDEPGSEVYRLPDNLQITTLIPLAGHLLEYPVVYIPTSGEQNVFLPGVPLDIYHCKLTFTCAHEHKTTETRNIEGHSLLKFSCPVSIGKMKDSLGSSNMKLHVDALFRERLCALEGTWSLDITHNVVTLDRVAL